MKGLIAIAAIAAASLLFVAASSPALGSGNLLQNPGAEAGPGSSSGNDYLPVPGWTTTPNFTAVKYGAPSFPGTTVSTKIGGGQNFFAGGQNTARSTATQTVDVTTSSAEIDAGQVQALLSAFIGGFSAQEDNGVVDAFFLNGSGSQLGSLRIGPVTAADRGGQTTLLPRSTTGLIPAGTRSIRVVMTATRLAGSYLDGYFDNLDLELKPSTLPPPVLGKRVNVATVSGIVLVRIEGTTQFVPLVGGQQIPTGSELDTTRGRVRLTSAVAGGSQTADFYQGRLVVTQPPRLRGLTDLRLSGRLQCASRQASVLSAVLGAPVRERHLWGSGKGRFRTRGKYASATVRGTEWLTQDRCTTTLVRVRTGRVQVFDFVRRRRVTISAGQTYVARRH